ncbi:MAG: hypothetical protein QM489_00775 [Candidatus Izemoplasma sp.]
MSTKPKIPKYDMAVADGQLCINFVCLELGVPISALIERLEPGANPPLLEVSFSKQITNTYSEEVLTNFQEQIFNCCLDTYEKQLKELK